MKKLLVLAFLVGLAMNPGIASAQFHGAFNVGFPMPTGDFADIAKPGFSGGAELYYSLPQLPNLQLGGRAAYNWFDLEDDQPEGSYSIIELTPSARYMFRDYSDTYNVFNVFLQVGAGAYRWNIDLDDADGDDGFDFGFNVGVGASGRFTDRWSFYIQPQFHWVSGEDENLTYFPLNIGIMF